MSSTNRSDARNQHIADYYVTPQKAISMFLEKFCEDEGIDLSTQKHEILDSCAGGNPHRVFHVEVDESDKQQRKKLLSVANSVIKTCGEYICTQNENDMSYPAVLFEMGADYNKILTNDIRENSPAKLHLDFLEKIAFERDFFDLVITNPPFNIAQDVIVKALECCKEGGYVVMLLRLNYFGGKVRQNFWKKHMPIRAYVHNRRMSFTPDGSTDSVEYMHCVWKKGENPKETKLSLLFDF